MKKITLHSITDKIDRLLESGEKIGELQAGLDGFRIGDIKVCINFRVETNPCYLYIKDKPLDISENIIEFVYYHCYHIVEKLEEKKQDKVYKESLKLLTEYINE